MPKMEFQTFHTGRPLNLWERCCLTSFVERGYAVVLYSYEPLALLQGVRFAPAQDIVSQEERGEFLRVAANRVSQFSNLFRYNLLHRRGGWWIDTDILCLSGSFPKDELVIGAETADTVGTAILRFPAGHELLAEAAAFARENRGVELWGYTGPKLVTRLVAERGLKDKLSEPRLYYPVHYSEICDLFDPERAEQVAKMVEGSPVVHLWSRACRIMGLQQQFLPPAGSFLGDAFRRHGGEGAPELELAAYRSHILRLRQFYQARETALNLTAELERVRQDLAFARAKAVRL